LKEGHIFTKLFILAICILLSIKFIFDYNGFWSLFKSIGGSIVGVLSYILVGFVIAYVLDAFVTFLTNKVFKKWTKHPKFKRILCIIIAYITFLGIIFLIVFSIIPYIVSTVKTLWQEFPNTIANARVFYRNMMEEKFQELPSTFYEKIEEAITKAIDSIATYINPTKITNILSATTVVIINAVLGFIVSIYTLIEKDSIKTAASNVANGLFSEKTGKNLRFVVGRTNDVFKHYFTGKLIQALFVITIAFIVFTIARVPYPILFAVVVGVFNMIPYIGPWVGAVPVVFICLINDFWKGIIALVCVLVIQAIDNFIVAPRVVGNQIGLPPLAVLAGLCIGGKLFGIPGMILGDVLAALVKVFFYDTFISNRIKAKKEKQIETSEETPEVIE